VPRGSLETLAADRDFPALARAADADYLQQFLVSSGATDASDVHLERIDVLNHKPGRRCTIHYSFRTPDGRFEVIGKWYHDASEAARMHALHKALDEACIKLPRPLAVNDDGLFLEEFVAARELRDLVFESDLEPFAAAGRWLAALQADVPPAGLAPKSLAHEVAKVEDWGCRITARVPEWAGEVEATLAQLRRRTSKMSEPQAVLMHRDYYPANLLWDRSTLWGIDFDQMAIGDAAVDAGAFLAQLEKVAIRDSVPRADFDAQARAFLSAYQGARCESLGSRLSFFESYTFLKVAAAEVERGRPRWRELAAAYLERAHDEASEA
jgi:aminoglycoside/choline kinase family phosphotransferase